MEAMQVENSAAASQAATAAVDPYLLHSVTLGAGADTPMRSTLAHGISATPDPHQAADPSPAPTPPPMAAAWEGADQEQQHNQHKHSEQQPADGGGGGVDGGGGGGQQAGEEGKKVKAEQGWGFPEAAILHMRIYQRLTELLHCFQGMPPSRPKTGYSSLVHDVSFRLDSSSCVTHVSLMLGMHVRGGSLQAFPPSGVVNYINLGNVHSFGNVILAEK
jgi:hypothetical protein